MSNISDKFMEISGKIGSQRHLIAIRDSFISMMPITMAGTVAVLLNVFLRDIPNNMGWTGFAEAMQPIIITAMFILEPLESWRLSLPLPLVTTCL